MAVLHTDCPECGEPIVFAEEIEIGDLTTCNECGTELEVADMDEEEIVLEVLEKDGEVEDEGI